MEIQGTHSLDTWKQALAYIVQKGNLFTDEHQRTGQEVYNLTLRVEDVSSGVTLPIVHLQQIQEWTYPSLHEIAEVALGKKSSSFYGYVYGERIFKYQGVFHQLQEFVIPLLKKTPLTRRCIVNVYDPLFDAKMENQYVPGIIALNFFIRDDLLHVSVFVRSNDIFIGWPANIYQIYLILEYVAQRIDKQMGSISTHSVNAHIFEEYHTHIHGLLRS
jgi:thymidylate synthase